MKSILLLAKKHDIAFCVVVSGNSPARARLLPWNARRRTMPLVKALVVADVAFPQQLSCRRTWGRIMYLVGEVQVRRNEAPPSDAGNSSFPGCSRVHMYLSIHKIKDHYFVYIGYTGEDQAHTLL